MNSDSNTIANQTECLCCCGALTISGLTCIVVSTAGLIFFLALYYHQCLNGDVQYSCYQSDLTASFVYSEPRLRQVISIQYGSASTVGTVFLSS